MNFLISIFFLASAFVKFADAFHIASIGPPMASSLMIVSRDKAAPKQALRTSTSDTVESKSATEWTKSRLHNSSPFRGLAILAAMVGAGAASKTFLPKAAAATLHLLSFGTWFGSMSYTTFIAGLTMFQNLPRKTFGKLQSKLFPKYFALCSASLVLQLVTLPVLNIASTKRSLQILGVGLAFTLLNQFYLEPKSTSVMFERYRLDDIPGAADSEEYKSLRAQFGKLHGMSSLTNLIALCSGVAHAVFLAAGLVQ